MNLIDTIRRVPNPVRKVLEERKALTKDMFDYLGDRLSTINEIILIGSGTSHTSCQTSKEFVETASGFRVIIVTVANSLGNIRVFELLPKLKTKKYGWCIA